MISYTKLNKLMLIGLVTISVETEVVREKKEKKKKGRGNEGRDVSSYMMKFKKIKYI